MHLYQVGGYKSRNVCAQQFTRCRYVTVALWKSDMPCGRHCTNDRASMSSYMLIKHHCSIEYILWVWQHSWRWWKVVICIGLGFGQAPRICMLVGTEVGNNVQRWGSCVGFGSRSYSLKQHVSIVEWNLLTCMTLGWFGDKLTFVLVWI